MRGQKMRAVTLTAIRLPEVCKRTGLSKATIYRLIQNQAFPAPRKISLRASAWNSSEVEAWLEGKLLVGVENDE